MRLWFMLVACRREFESTIVTDFCISGSGRGGSIVVVVVVFHGFNENMSGDGHPCHNRCRWYRGGGTEEVVKGVMR